MKQNKNKKTNIGLIINSELKDKAYFIIQNQMNMTITDYISNNFKQLIEKHKNKVA